MGWRDLIKRKEALVTLDIGSSSLKLLELDLTSVKPRLVSIAVSPLPGDAISNNAVSKAEKVSEQIISVMQANSVQVTRAVTVVPAPSVFTKRVRISKMTAAELGPYIEMEAANFIPHNVNAVKMDYHVLGEVGGQLEVLVVAVKTDIVDSYLNCLLLSGIETAVVDVDHFALQNSFEMNYPEYFSGTTALINIGSRYSGLNVVRAGDSLFTGDISVGGRMLTEALSEKLGVSFDEAEKNKRNINPQNSEHAHMVAAIDPGVDQIVNELNRQLSFFWSANNSEGSIDRIMLAGGGALAPGIEKRLSEKTAIPVEFIDPFRSVEVGPNFSNSYLKGLAPLMAISVGLGIRQAGDRDLSKIH